MPNADDYAQTYILDSAISEFKIKIHSLTPLGVEQLKDHIQKMYKVIEIKLLRSEWISVKGMNDFF